MEWYDVLVATLFAIGITAYPGWNLILRLDFNWKNQIKSLTKPAKQIKNLSKPFNQVKSLSKPSKPTSELEKIFGI